MRNLKLRASQGKPFILIDFEKSRIDLSGNATSKSVGEQFVPALLALQTCEFASKAIEVHLFLEDISIVGGTEIIRFLKSIKKKGSMGYEVICHWYFEDADHMDMGKNIGDLVGLKTITEWIPGVDQPEYGI